MPLVRRFVIDTVLLACSALAALATEDIEHEPVPFVLQTDLDDSYVAYQINAYTRQTLRIGPLRSALLANLQDESARRGIEIMSPVYHALRDGNASTIPPPVQPDR
jgi:small-conductance mechanosensitive channel